MQLTGLNWKCYLTLNRTFIKTLNCKTLRNQRFRQLQKVVNMHFPTWKAASSSSTVKRGRHYSFSTSKYWLSTPVYRGKGTCFPCSQFLSVLTSTSMIWANSSFVKPWNKRAFVTRWANVFSGRISKQPRYPMETRRTLANIRKFGNDALNLSDSKFLMVTSDNPVTAHRSRIVILFVTLACLKRAPGLLPDHWWPNNHGGKLVRLTIKSSRLLSARLCVVGYRIKEYFFKQQEIYLL